MKQRKAVQICPHPGGIAALADDGTIWWSNGSQGWVQMPALPDIEIPDTNRFKPSRPPGMAVTD